MNGIINVYKEKGMTSHDVVNIVRKVFKTKRVGHTGTLDPMATGVLPICVGTATRVAEYLTEKNKTYIATVAFGYETDTQDSDGEKIKAFSLPDLSFELFDKICQSFLGIQVQIPPMYSAVKYKGTPLYKYARNGIVISDLPKREITVFSIDLLSYNKDTAVLKIECSKGTYIRTLCADIARKANTGGYLIALERVQSGVFELSETVSLEEIKKTSNPEKLLLPTIFALKSFSQLILDNKEVTKVKNGMKINVEKNDTDIAVATYKENLVAIGSVKNNCFIPRKVFNNYE